MLDSVGEHCLDKTYELEAKVDVELFALLKLQDLSVKLIAYSVVEGRVGKGREEEYFTV